MFTINGHKNLTIPFFLSLLVGCNTPFTTVKTNETEPSVQSQPMELAWQRADGKEGDILAKPSPPELDLVTPAPITDLWQLIRNGYALSQPQLHVETKKKLTWYVNHPEYINRVVERARPYLHHIVDELKQRHMPLEIALLPIVESGFQPFVYSHAQAAGLWQFIPRTGEAYGLKQNWWYDGRRDIIESTRAALDYLEKLHNYFGDWQLALAAYNCGEGTVNRAIKRNKKAGKPIDFWSLDLPKETAAYLPKLMALAFLIQQPESYNITLSPINNAPFLTVVDIETQIDLALAAKLAEISIEEIYQLNPGFNQWVTPPNGPHRLVIPLEKTAVFQKALDALPLDKRVQWARHKIKLGESLSVIAKQYKTTVAMLKETNKLSSNTIRSGRHLLVPIVSGKLTDYPLTISPRSEVRQNMPQRSDKKIHTVTVGDTWWDLADLYKVGIRQLARWNNQTPVDTLHLGQKLQFWTDEKPSALSTKISTINYEIQRGDSLWGISKKFDVSVAQIRQWNGLSQISLLMLGQNLTIHVDLITPQHSRI